VFLCVLLISSNATQVFCFVFTPSVETPCISCSVIRCVQWDIGIPVCARVCACACVCVCVRAIWQPQKRRPMPGLGCRATEKQDVILFDADIHTQTQTNARARILESSKSEDHVIRRVTALVACFAFICPLSPLHS
jgi:hypothetical protein